MLLTYNVILISLRSLLNSSLEQNIQNLVLIQRGFPLMNHFSVPDASNSGAEH